jgi:hypothetical protein
MPRGTIRRGRSLDAVLAYRNPDVVYKFHHTWDVTRAESQRLFDDTLRYLWVMSRVEFEIVPVSIIDEMWHTFLQFTKAYSDWCMASFGRMLHHNPVSPHEQRSGKKISKAALVGEIERDVTAVYDHLGEAVTRRWYVTYAERYPAAFFNTARRPIETPAARWPKVLAVTNRGSHG